MIIAVPKEVQVGERRVAASPESVQKLVKLGFTVRIEQGAGQDSSFSDQAYVAAGAEVVADVRALWHDADLVLKVNPPQAHPSDVHEVDLLRTGGKLISFVWPARNGELLQKLAARGATVLAMDAVPRISRAQKLDALSSMANIAGYRAVIEAAHHFGSFFTGQITAAGKVPPAKVLVIGAGVAGLAAIGAARGLGAIVRAFDTRPEVKDQVKSMGADFLELDVKEDGSGSGGYAKVMSPEFIKAEMELFARQAKDCDIIITTALIPGKKAPTLITADMVRSMKAGSVIVDLAAEQGGNCELTQPGQVARVHGVTIIGFSDLPSRLPTQASRLYANNLVHFVTDLRKAAGEGSEPGTIKIDTDDEVVRGALVLNAGTITWPPPANVQSAAAKAAAAAAAVPKKEAAKPQAHAHGTHGGAGKTSVKGVVAYALVSAAVLSVLGSFAPPDFMQHLTVFILACFIGWQVIWNVTPALHTPLMSVTNAISGIIVIGAMLQIKGFNVDLATVLAAMAVLLATINVAGGFLVTRRMLGMFRK